MKKTRCKPGDLAVVISAKNKRNLGIIVKIIDADDRKGTLRYPLGTPAWLVESQKPLTWVVDGQRHCYHRGPVPDAQLQPIRANPQGKKSVQKRELPAKQCGTFTLREGLEKMTSQQRAAFIGSLEASGFLPFI
jgi:hypothetical protein